MFVRFPYFPMYYVEIIYLIYIKSSEKRDNFNICNPTNFFS